MQLFYGWLLVVTGAMTCADYYLYEYKFWYVQGLVMFFIIILAMATFGCGDKQIELTD